MNVRALRRRSLAIAIAATFLSGSTCAGPLLCEQATRHGSVQSSCPDSNGHYIKNKHPIDHLLDSAMPAATSVAIEWRDFAFESEKKLDERLLHLWLPLWSNGLGFGLVLNGGSKWTLVQLREGQPGHSVPEPGSLLLLGIGLLGAAVSRRLR